MHYDWCTSVLVYVNVLALGVGVHDETVSKVSHPQLFGLLCFCTMLLSLECRLMVAIDFAMATMYVECLLQHVYT